MECLTLLRITVSGALLIAVTFPTMFAAVPVITNVLGEQRPGTDLVDVYYDLDAANSTSVAVRLEVSADGGANWTVPVVSVSQSVGSGVSSGKRKHILWNAGADWNGRVSKNVRFRVTASDASSLQFGLVAYYPFDGNANDASGNNLNLASDGVMPTTDRFGRSDAAYKFDGFNDWLHSDNIPEPSNNAFSWVLWIRPAVIPSGAEWGQWVLNRNNANSFDFMVSPHLTLKPGGTIMFTSYDNRLDGNQNWMNALSSNTKLVVDQWYHIVCTSGIDNTRRIYINGVLDSSLVSSGYGQTGLGTINIGADRNPLYRGAGWPGWFQGIIDDVRIYGRELSATEVTNLYETKQ